MKCYIYVHYTHDICKKTVCIKSGEQTRQYAIKLNNKHITFHTPHLGH